MLEKEKGTFDKKLDEEALTKLHEVKGCNEKKLNSVLVSAIKTNERLCSEINDLGSQVKRQKQKIEKEQLAAYNADLCWQVDKWSRDAHELTRQVDELTEVCYSCLEDHPTRAFFACGHVTCCDSKKCKAPPLYSSSKHVRKTCRLCFCIHTGP